MRKKLCIPRLRWTSVALFLIPAVISAGVCVVLLDERPETYSLDMTLALDHTGSVRPMQNIVKPSVVGSPPLPMIPLPVLSVPPPPPPHMPIFVTEQIFNASPLLP